MASQKLVYLGFLVLLGLSLGSAHRVLVQDPKPIKLSPAPIRGGGGGRGFGCSRSGDPDEGSIGCLPQVGDNGGCSNCGFGCGGCAGNCPAIIVAPSCPGYGFGTGCSPSYGCGGSPGFGGGAAHNRPNNFQTPKTDQAADYEIHSGHAPSDFTVGEGEPMPPPHGSVSTEIRA